MILINSTFHKFLFYLLKTSPYFPISPPDIKQSEISPHFYEKLLFPLLASVPLRTAVNGESFYLPFGTYESKERATRIEESPNLHASPFFH